MQNNIISCVVVVYLSVAASVLIGAFSTLFRAVPAAMVTGVLYITSGKLYCKHANFLLHNYNFSLLPRTYLYSANSFSSSWSFFIN